MLDIICPQLVASIKARVVVSLLPIVPHNMHAAITGVLGYINQGPHKGALGVSDGLPEVGTPNHSQARLQPMGPL